MSSLLWTLATHTPSNQWTGTECIKRTQKHWLTDWLRNHTQIYCFWFVTMQHLKKTERNKFAVRDLNRAIHNHTKSRLLIHLERYLSWSEWFCFCFFFFISFVPFCLSMSFSRSLITYCIRYGLYNHHALPFVTQSEIFIHFFILYIRMFQLKKK